jgi:hypothetical protein
MARRTGSADLPLRGTQTRASRLVPKIDSAAVQDGFDLYLHGFLVTNDGKWTVVQHGMNGDKPPVEEMRRVTSRALTN